MDDELAVTFIFGIIIGLIIAIVANTWLISDDIITTPQYARYEKACSINAGIKNINATKGDVTCNNGAVFDYSSLYYKHTVDKDPPTYDILEDKTIK